MELNEKKLTSELIYDGKVVHLYKDTVELPNGKEADREVVRHVGAVGVIPINENNEVYLVKQYRYPFDEVLTEIPAGKLDSYDEDLLEAAKRELREETGITADKFIYIGAVYPSCAILDEVIHLYIAEELSFGECDPDEDEFLNVVKVPYVKALYDAVLGRIPDAKTQIGLLKTSFFLGEKRLEKDINSFQNENKL